MLPKIATDGLGFTCVVLVAIFHNSNNKNIKQNKKTKTNLKQKTKNPPKLHFPRTFVTDYKNGIFSTNSVKYCTDLLSRN